LEIRAKQRDVIIEKAVKNVALSGKIGRSREMCSFGI
jgi:ribosome modulation factor